MSMSMTCNDSRLRLGSIYYSNDILSLLATFNHHRNSCASHFTYLHREALLS